MTTIVYNLKVSGNILYEATDGESVQEVLAYFNRLISDKDFSKIPNVAVSEVENIYVVGCKQLKEKL